MPTNEYTVKTWKEFLSLLEKFVPQQSKLHREMGFRGQERDISDWKLRPSLARRLPETCSLAEAIQIEVTLLREFQLDGHRNLPPQEVPPHNHEYRNIGGLMAMQQYGAPTRLLDWTYSPYVAAYFAVRDVPDEDGVLWIHNYSSLVEALKASDIKGDLYRIDKALAGEVPQLSNPPRICALFLRELRSERMYVQQGFPMVCEDPRRSHDEVMQEIAEAAEVKPFLHKVVIKNVAKDQFLANLRMMNITGASLFPGPDGLGRQLSESGRLLAGGLVEAPVQGTANDSRSDTPRSSGA